MAFVCFFIFHSLLCEGVLVREEMKVLQKVLLVESRSLVFRWIAGEFGVMAGGDRKDSFKGSF